MSYLSAPTKSRNPQFPREICFISVGKCYKCSMEENRDYVFKSAFLEVGSCS